MIIFLKKYFESQCDKDSNEGVTDSQKNLGINLIPAKNIKCKCKREEDINIVKAMEIYGDVAFMRHLKNEGIEFQCPYIISESMFTIEIGDTIIRISHDLGIFTKSACLSCNTCLGWIHETGYYDEYTKVSESPEEYFSRIIREHVWAEKKRIAEKELALKICGENDEIV